ncbi:uncharacterized protein LOC116256125 [Nymphaea colorata]|uniref:uncharacterized protein LOC116256125 n=1 Tax=Nymphaea colorata TaxID=210225 RepID=UPI00129E4644|nr:uncharacterized protein LOC116256125 [Nymphaea colorata]
MPSRVLNWQTPHSMLPKSREPLSLPPRVFGCVCFIHNHSSNIKKLDPRSVKGIFLGYSPTQKGYKCRDPSTGRAHVTKDVTFLEHASYFGENSLQGERSTMREEYSPSHEIQSTDFLEYKKEEIEVTNPLEHNEDDGCSPVDKERHDHLFGQVYSRQKSPAAGPTDGADEAMLSGDKNPTPNPNATPFLDDPSRAQEMSVEELLLKLKVIPSGLMRCKKKWKP